MPVLEAARLFRERMIWENQGAGGNKKSAAQRTEKDWLRDGPLLFLFASRYLGHKDRIDKDGAFVPVTSSTDWYS